VAVDGDIDRQAKRRIAVGEGRRSGGQRKKKRQEGGFLRRVFVKKSTIVETEQVKREK